MKILHIDTGREMRGGQRQALLLLRGLAGRGHEQRLLAGRWREQAGALLPAGVRCGAAGGFAAWLNLWREASWADLIHAHDARAHTLAALAGRGKPLVVARRVAFPVKRSPFSHWKYGRANAFLAVSEFVKRELLAAAVPEEKIELVYDGCPLPDSPPPQPPEGRPPRIVAPLIDDPLKGGAWVAEACRRAGVEPLLSSDLDADLRPGDILLYLSQSEGLGSAVLLAAAKGAAVIASRVGGIPEIVEHERTGLLCANSPPEIAAQLRRLAGDRELRLRLAAAAWEQLAGRFRDTIVIRRTEEIYERLLRGPR